MKDIKHIRRDFYSVAWVMPQKVGLRGTGGTQGVKQFFFEHGHVAYQIDGDDEQTKCK